MFLSIPVCQVPVGTVCVKNGTTGEPLPVISSQFSASVERLTLHSDQEVQRIGSDLYVDMDSDIYRMDITQPMADNDQKQFGKVPLTMVFDYRSGINQIYLHSAALF